MKIQVERVDPVRQFAGKTIVGPVFFGLETAEQMIPEHKSDAIVFIEILWLRAMMYAVIGGSTEGILYGRMQLSDTFGVYPELV